MYRNYGAYSLLMDKLNKIPGFKATDIEVESASYDGVINVGIHGYLDKEASYYEMDMIPSDFVKRSSGRYPWGSVVENSYLIERKRIKFNYLPTKIIFSGPATICIFANGSKEVVKKTEDDPDDKEKAVLYCIMKHSTKADFGYFKKNLSNLIEEAEDGKID